MDTDKILRAYTRLKSLREKMPPKGAFYINERFVKEYHEIISSLEQETGFSLDEFKIPSEDMEKAWVGSSGERDYYTKDYTCNIEIFLSKMDALLSYFELRFLSNEKPDIGFKPS